jgi:four helix bundle protein
MDLGLGGAEGGNLKEKVPDEGEVVKRNANTFEDLLAWQQARELATAVYQATASGRLATDRALCDQLRRASASVMANIAGGFERGRRTEFHQFLSIAKGSCAEVRSLLYVTLDARLLDRESFDRLLNLALSVSRIVSRLRSAVAKQRDTGRK